MGIFVRYPDNPSDDLLATSWKECTNLLYMLRTLCLDFGNLRQKAALFEGDTLKEARVLSDARTENVSALLRDWKPDHSILSSVIDHEPGVAESLEKHTRFHLLSHNTRLNFTTPVGKQIGRAHV